MKVFISSVRRGLEGERDALPGLILALGHEPVRFEDFTAQPVPSREACLAGVERSDAYLLLLGATYGDPVFDTGLSPTEEEFNVARRRGIPILVFSKRAVDIEAPQREFVRRVEEYTGGRFRAAFDGPVDLQAQVARALRDLAAPAESLVWRQVEEPIEVPWVQTEDRIQGFSSTGATLECHLVAVNPNRRILARDLEALPATLGRLGRDQGFFSSDEALDLGADSDTAWASAGKEHRSLRHGIRVRRDGTVSVWTELPSDGLGQLFDPDDIRERLSAALLLGFQAGPATSDELAPAVGVAPVALLVEGKARDLGHRTSATLGSPRVSAARVDPEESIPRAALSTAREEIALELATRLTQAFRATRHW